MMYDQSKNNIAVLLRIRYAALDKFVRKYGIDTRKLEAAVMKSSKLRQDLIVAVSGYDDNEIAQDIAGKFKLEENRRALDFFTTKHGLAIARILKKNNKQFDAKLVTKYIDDINEMNDLKWGRILDGIANSLGLPYGKYQTYGEQVEAIVSKVEELYPDYLKILSEKIIVSKGKVNKLIIEVTQKETEPQTQKRYQVTEPQLETIINHAVKLSGPQHPTQHELDDSFIASVHTSQLTRFKEFLATLPGLKMMDLQKYGDTLYIRVGADHRDSLDPLKKFIREELSK